MRESVQELRDWLRRHLNAVELAKQRSVLKILQQNSDGAAKNDRPKRNTRIWCDHKRRGRWIAGNDRYQNSRRAAFEVEVTCTGNDDVVLTHHQKSSRERCRPELSIFLCREEHRHRETLQSQWEYYNFAHLGGEGYAATARDRIRGTA